MIKATTVANGNAWSGGGIAVSRSNITLQSGVQLLDNTATSDARLRESHGGGLAAFSGSRVEVVGAVSMRGNSASRGGGMALLGSVTRVRGAASLEGNEGLESGGAVAVLGGYMSIEGEVQIRGNSAGAAGGGVVVSLATLMLRGGVRITENACLDTGGGVWVLEGTVQVSGGVSVRDNVASKQGGGVFALESTLVLRGGDLRRNVVSGGLGEGSERFGAVGGSGGGIFGMASVVVLEAGLEVAENVAAVGGGGFFYLGSRLEADGCLWSQNEALAGGGGLNCVDAACDLSGATEVTRNVGGAEGGGIRCINACELSLRGVRVALNSAQRGGGVLLWEGDLSMTGSEVQSNVAEFGGGCVAGERSAVEIAQSSLAECRAGTDGGGLLLTEETEGLLLDGVVIRGNTAGRNGGGVHVQGSQLEVRAAMTEVEGNSAGADGGGISYMSPVVMGGGLTKVWNNSAGSNGGGLAGTGWSAEWGSRAGADAELVVREGHQLRVEGNSAGQDGGGVALIGDGELSLERESCPEACSAAMAGNGVCDMQCLHPGCGWDGGECRALFEEAGVGAAGACGNPLCLDATSQALFEGHCFTECMVPACDWNAALGAATCLHHFEVIRACPAIEAAVLSSLSAAPDVVYVGPGGPAGGYGRCVGGACFDPAVTPQPAVEEGECAQGLCNVTGMAEGEWCYTLDRQAEGSWGLCSRDRPRLPALAFEYDAQELARVHGLSIAELFGEFPGCGSVPLVLRSNRAARNGGGMFKSSCDPMLDQRLQCFVGNTEFSSTPAVQILMEHNSAGNAGGAVFADCHTLGPCRQMLSQSLGLPHVLGEEERVLRMRGNQAEMYGSDVATAAQSLSVSPVNASYAAGRSTIAISISLFDSLEQPVQEHLDETYIVQFLVCALDDADCNSQTSLQPPFFVFMPRETPVFSAGVRAQVLQWCEEGVNAVRVAVSLMGHGYEDLAPSQKEVRVDCLPCGEGEARSSATVDGRRLWRCNQCAESEYVVDPNNEKYGCQVCPVGAICRDGKLFPKQEGEVWVVDRIKGQYRLVGCPAGTELLDRDLSGAFAHGQQLCKACNHVQYNVDPNRFMCQDCPQGAECTGSLLRTRGGLDAVWRQDSQGQLWLQRCPPGYRMENSTGYEKQQCQLCGPGMYVLSSEDSSFQCRACPRTVICRDGFPPTLGQATGTVTVLESAAGSVSSELLVDVKAALSSAARDSAVLLTSACNSSGSCEQLQDAQLAEGAANTSESLLRRVSRGASSGGRKGVGARAVLQSEEGEAAVRVSFAVESAQESSATLKDLASSAEFRATVAAELARLGRGTPVSLAIAEESAIIGTFVPQGQSLVLRDCPVGYLIVNASTTDQFCKQCLGETYSLDPLDGCDEGQCENRECTECPLGARCRGGSSFEPRDGELSSWEVVQAGNRKLKRLVGCPAGYIGVRDEAYPALDQCVPCQPSTYSLLPARLGGPRFVKAAQDAVSTCKDCAYGARCLGRDRVLAREGFWCDLRGGEGCAASDRHGNVSMYYCPEGSCMDASECAEGQTGPVCALCVPGRTLSGQGCIECRTGVELDSARFLALAAVVLLFLVVWYYSAWRPYLVSDSLTLTRTQSTTRETNEFSLPRRIAGLCSSKYGRTCGEQLSNLKGGVLMAWHRLLLHLVQSHYLAYSKVFISFWQVTTTFRTNFNIPWARELRVLWEWTSVFRLNLVELPGPSCWLGGMGYLGRLQLYTGTFAVLALLLSVPSLIVRARGQGHEPRYNQVRNNWWFSCMMWTFLLYPLLSLVTIRTFKCMEVGGVNYLFADFSVRCPYEEPGSPLFLWALISTLLFPIGIPAFIFWALWHHRVPHLARKKRDLALFGRMAWLHRMEAEENFSAKLAGYMGGYETGALGSGDLDQTQHFNAVIEERARRFFDAATKHGREELTANRLMDYCRTIGVFGEHHGEVEALFLVFDEDGNRALEWDEFLELMRAVVEMEHRVTHFDRIEAVPDSQIDDMCSFDWSHVQAMDEEEESGLEREMKRRLKKKYRNQKHDDHHGSKAQLFLSKYGQRPRRASASSSSNLQPLVTNTPQARARVGMLSARGSVGSVQSSVAGSRRGSAGDMMASMVQLHGPGGGVGLTGGHRASAGTREGLVAQHPRRSLAASVQDSESSERGGKRRRRGGMDAGELNHTHLLAAVSSLRTARRAEDEDRAEDPRRIPRCDLPSDAPREEKVEWLLKTGRKLMSRGAIELATITWQESQKEEKDAMNRVGFLFDAYKADYWYYECIDLLRKFLMTGVMGLLFQNSLEQLALGMLITLVALMHLVRVQPYTSVMINHMQSVSLAVQAATLLYGIIVSFERQEEQLTGQKAASRLNDMVILLLNLIILFLPPIAVFHEEGDVIQAYLRRNCCSCLKPDDNRERKRRLSRSGSFESALDSPLASFQEEGPGCGRGGVPNIFTMPGKLQRSGVHGGFSADASDEEDSSRARAAELQVGREGSVQPGEPPAAFGRVRSGQLGAGSQRLRSRVQSEAGDVEADIGFMRELGGPLQGSGFQPAGGTASVASLASLPFAVHGDVGRIPSVVQEGEEDNVRRSKSVASTGPRLSSKRRASLGAPADVCGSGSSLSSAAARTGAGPAELPFADISLAPRQAAEGLGTREELGFC